MSREIILQTSLIKGFFEKKSTPIELCRVFDFVTTNSELKEATEKYRTTNDFSIKRSLYCITPACLLNGTGKEASDVIARTGITMVDFDDLSPEACAKVIELAKKDVHTLWCSYTISGRGVRVLSLYDLGMDYTDAFLLVNIYYSDLTGEKFDSSCCNINRLSVLCYDPDTYFNPEAVPFSFLDDNDMELAANPPTSPVDGGGGAIALNNSREETPIEFAVRVVENKGEMYVQGHRNNFLMHCLMLMNRLGVSRQEAEAWALSYNLGEKETLNIVRSCYRHTEQFGSFEFRPSRGTRSYNTRVPQVEPNANAKCKGLPHGTRDIYNNLRGVNNIYNGDSGSSATTDNEQEKIQMKVPKGFADYAWPLFLQQMVDCGESKSQQDVLLLGAITVLGSSLNSMLRFLYGHKYLYPCLQGFVVAPPASGKGVLTWTRKLVEPIHNELMVKYNKACSEYEKAKREYDIAGNRRKEMEIPKIPPLKMFLIAGNNTSSGILENLITSDGKGLIIESEADTVSTAIGCEYGHWSDTLRKAFDHDRLSFNRRTNHEYREINQIYLSVLLSGTPAQLLPLIPSSENGLFSRQLFYAMPVVEKWKNQLNNSEDDHLDSKFEAWGREWKRLLDDLKQQVSVIDFKLTEEQIEYFNGFFSCMFDTSRDVLNGNLRSSVTRLAINTLRIMSVVALLRAIKYNPLVNGEKEAKFSWNVVGNECFCRVASKGGSTRYVLRATDEDFKAVVQMATPLYRHTIYALTMLPEAKQVARKVKTMDVIMSHLGNTFTMEEFCKVAEDLGVNLNTAKSCLQRYKNDEKIKKNDSGSYYKVRVP